MYTIFFNLQKNKKREKRHCPSVECQKTAKYNKVTHSPKVIVQHEAQCFETNSAVAEVYTSLLHKRVQFLKSLIMQEQGPV